MIEKQNTPHVFKHAYLKLLTFFLISLFASWKVSAISSIEVISTDTNGNIFQNDTLYPSISNDGKVAVFERHISSGPSSLREIHIKYIDTNTSFRISPANADCTNPIISGNGRYILYSSSSANIIPGLSDGKRHIYVYDTINDSTNLIDLNLSGSVGNASASHNYDISDNGTLVTYQSGASNLVAGDTNNLTDVFLYDRLNLTVERVSLDNNGNQLTKTGTTGDINWFQSMSDNGRYIMFKSTADNFGGGSFYRSYIWDRSQQSIIEAVFDNNGGKIYPYKSASMSANGRFVSFISSDPDLPGWNGSEQVYLYDRSSVTVSILSTDGVNSGNNDSDSTRVSASGRYVTFSSLASNIISGDNNNLSDIFVVDRKIGSRVRVSENTTGTGGNGENRAPVTQSTAQNIVFATKSSNLVANDNNILDDVYLAKNDALASVYEISMIPSSLPFVISSSGGSVTHNVTVKNIDTNNRTISLFRRILAPDGSVLSLGDNNYTIPPNNYVNESNLTYSIPGGLANGRYEVVYYVFENGSYVDEESYFFYKI